MAVVMRGWSKTASTALKLATAERIIGYQFKDVDKLYEALDQTGLRLSLPSGKTSSVKRRNFRLALVGDALGSLRMARDWYDRASLSGLDWTEIQQSTLSNERLGEVGFKLGLDECAISKEIVKPYDMATTLEALIAAVHMDGAGEEHFRKVCARFGVEHKRLEPAGRLWIWELVRSKLSLPDEFFIGNHLKLQEGVFETQLKRSPARKKQETWLWRHVRPLWRLTRQLWQPRKEAETKPDSKKKLKQLASRSATQPPGKVVPLAKRSKSAATTTITNPPVDESISKTERLVEDSVGHRKENEKAVAPEKMTESLAESSTSETPASAYSGPSRRQPRSILEEGTSADDGEPAETGSQDSNTTFNGEAAPTPSSVAATGTEKQVEHSAHEASEADPAEPATEDDPKAQLKRKAKEMLETTKTLQKAILKMQKAGKKMTRQDKTKVKTLIKQRQNILDERSRILQPSKTDS